MNEHRNNLKIATSDLIATCGRDYAFPAGGQIALLTPQESTLLNELTHRSLSTSDKLLCLAEDHDWSACYTLVTFAVRLAVMGVRQRDCATFKIATLALVATSPKIDWRDTLGVLAIFEDCASQLEFDFQSDVKRILIFSDAKELRSLIDTYFSRSPEMRSVSVMGISKVGEGKDLTYIGIS